MACESPSTTNHLRSNEQVNVEAQHGRESIDNLRHHERLTDRGGPLLEHRDVATAKIGRIACETLCTLESLLLVFLFLIRESVPSCLVGDLVLELVDLLERGERLLEEIRRVVHVHVGEDNKTVEVDPGEEKVDEVSRMYTNKQGVVRSLGIVGKSLAVDGVLPEIAENRGRRTSHVESEGSEEL